MMVDRWSIREVLSDIQGVFKQSPDTTTVIRKARCELSCPKTKLNEHLASIQGQRSIDPHNSHSLSNSRIFFKGFSLRISAYKP